MKKRMTSIAALACLVAGTWLASASAGEIWNVEQGYEVQQLRVVMTGPDKGQVTVRACDNCRDMTLRIVPQTRLIVGDEELPLSEMTRFRGKEGVVFRATNTDLVTRIRIY